MVALVSAKVDVLGTAPDIRYRIMHYTMLDEGGVCMSL